ncbi:MAG TPA: hypothetical protein V6D50_06335 [Chroococcales cyanobacterium]
MGDSRAISIYIQCDRSCSDCSERAALSRSHLLHLYVITLSHLLGTLWILQAIVNAL